VNGNTTSTNFPPPVQGSLAGGTDAYIVQLNPAGSAYSFGRYLGGTSLDLGGGRRGRQRRPGLRQRYDVLAGVPVARRSRQPRRLRRLLDPVQPV